MTLSDEIQKTIALLKEQNERIEEMLMKIAEALDTPQESCCDKE